MHHFAPFLLVAFIAFLVRLPSISADLPYFYNEDEAHHFNRTVEMVKEGRWNPEYFHKPSLHFYLRMPVVAASFLWNVKEGHIRTVDEIQTRNQFGLAGYNFTASHPGIVKWNRAFSVVLGVATVTLVAYLILLLTGSTFGATVGGLIAAIAPDLVKLDAVIGVDVVMGFFAMATVVVTLYAFRTTSRSGLFVAALLAGLTVSSKYNALPILAAPLLALSPTTLAAAPLLLLTSAFGFLIGSPFILAELPRFLNHFAYEIWHYGVAGHAGQMAEPGLPQVIHYTGWLMSRGIGALPLLVGLAGFVVLVRKHPRIGVITAAFPLLFFLLMIDQKTNFTRNMLVVVPFLAVGVGIFVAAFLERYRYRWIAVALLLAQPVAALLPTSATRESRDELVRWLPNLPRQADDEIALAGELQLPRSITSLPRTAVVPQRTTTLDALALSGFDYAIFGGASDAPPPSGALLVAGAGAFPARILRDPRLAVVPLSLPPEGGETIACSQFPCSFALGSAEPYRWISQRRFTIPVPTTTRTVTLSVRSPWPDQRLTCGSVTVDVPPSAEFTSYSFAVSSPGGTLSCTMTKVRSPKLQGGSPDDRRLGIALATVAVR